MAVEHAPSLVPPATAAGPSAPGTIGRLLRPVRSWRGALAGSLLWAVAMAAVSAAALGRITGFVDPHLSTLLSIFFLGGLAAFVPAMMAAGLVAAGRPAEARFSAGFVTLASATVLATGAAYGLQHIRLDIDWTGFPGPAFPFMDIPASMIESMAHFLVLGARFFAPEGLLPLVLASLWIARRLR